MNYFNLDMNEGHPCADSKITLLTYLLTAISYQVQSINLCNTLLHMIVVLDVKFLNTPDAQQFLIPFIPHGMVNKILK